MAEKLTKHEREEAIRARAYEHWQREGHPDSRHLEHWLKAEKELDEESSERQETGDSNNGETEREALQKVERDRIPQVVDRNDAPSDGPQKQAGGASGKTLKLFSKRDSAA